MKKRCAVPFTMDDGAIEQTNTHIENRLNDQSELNFFVVVIIICLYIEYGTCMKTASWKKSCTFGYSNLVTDHSIQETHMSLFSLLN